MDESPALRCNCIRQAFIRTLAALAPLFYGIEENHDTKVGRWKAQEADTAHDCAADRFHPVCVMLMPQGLRKAFPNWSGKAIMAVVGFLIIGFGIWAIRDAHRDPGGSTVAKVGRSELSVDEFRFRYNEQLQQLGRQAGRHISPNPEQAFGLRQKVLSEMIAAAALDERVRQLQLGIPDSEVMKQIVADPAFHGSNGQFDRRTFLQRIREGGYTEQRFISGQRQNALRLQVAKTVGAGLAAPKVAAEAILRYRDEERSIDYVTLDSSKAGDGPPPTPEQLVAYFEERKFAFRSPEYRKIQLMMVSQEDVAATIDVSEEEARRIYQDRLQLFAAPERRQIMQISFASAEDAKSVAERIAAGLAFDVLAKEPEIASRLVDLGTVTKADLVDPAIANAAFDLAEGAVSAPVTGRFGTVMLHVVKVEPPSTRPFDEVEPELKRDMAAHRAQAEVNNIRDKVDEERGGRAGLEEIAQRLNLKLRTIEAVDRSGRTPEGEPVANLPADVDVIDSAFNTKIGDENEALQIPGGGFVWYDVVSILTYHVRKFDEVKRLVEARFREDEIVRRINAKTAELIGKLKSGASLAELAAAEGLVVEAKSDLKRQGRTKLPAHVIAEVFRTPKDSVGSAQGENAIDRIIFRVSDVRIPAYSVNSATVNRVADRLGDTYDGDLVTQYLRRLEIDLGTDVNLKAVAQVVPSGNRN